MSLEDILESPRLMMKLSFPPVMLQLMQEASKPEPDFAVLGKIISMDPALSTTILNLVNSPFYGLSQEITDFKRAAVVLGTRELLNLAVTITYQKHICTNLQNDSYKIYNDWMLTVWGAISAQLIASRICPEQADQVYLCCLLKDISLLFLRCAAPGELPDDISKDSVTRSYSGQAETENDIWGMNHGGLSQLLLTRWKMDHLNCPALQHHHALDEIDTFDLPTQAVILATRWAEMELGNDSAPFNVLQFEVQLQRSLDMDEEAIEAFREVCRTKFQSMLKILGMADGEEDAHFYNHSIKNLQSSYFLSLELLTAEGGVDSIARTIGRHLKLSWDIVGWELALKSPHTDKYKLYRVAEGEGLNMVAADCPLDEIPWQKRGAAEDIVSRNMLLGRFRFDSKSLSAEDLKSLKLYFRFIGQAYEHYCAKQHLIEDRAETLETLPLGVASLDIQGDLIDMNEEMVRLLGGASISGSKNFNELFKLGLGAGLGASWDTFLSDDSRSSFSKIICASLRTGGMPRDACLYVSAYKQDRGEEHLISLVMEDIREISESQIQALKQRDFLEGLVDSMRDVVLTVDKRGHITYASSRFSKIFLGRNIFEIASPVETYTGRWGSDMFDREKTVVEVLLKRTDTAGRPFEFVISKLAGPGEKSLIVARDLTAIRRLEDKLKRQAVFDGLTDLFNHTQFNTLLAREINRSRRTGRPVGLLFFDLDGFKAVNDTEGHQVGDDVLKSVGEILRNELRSGMDFPCRYGGDEFGVIVTEVRAEALEKIGNRIRLRVEKKFSGKVTISGGLTVLKEGDTSAAMLNRADKATYEAKDLGGNVLVWAK
ncbi:HDOD domain-containing protein [Desulfovibrio sp. JC010]|uniref:sensor domain-containing diguanylate cyclase n=1 Tax=Desulfovibrio sp. JC010 TaxID=2593641 RepID=UPI0013D2B4C9|nr:HDOD domain-containing protein [Desulfovibrio sp. JC010]NDV25367.1 diguanylate cyclase [Desulfovibrio sp. JC010]